MLEHMVDDRANLEFHDGDYVTLLNDDWATVGCNLVLVAAEPVPGSTQCIVEANGESMVVSRNDLRLEDRRVAPPRAKKARPPRGRPWQQVDRYPARGASHRGQAAVKSCHPPNKTVNPDYMVNTCGTTECCARNPEADQDLFARL